jgi:hypothetical protein
MNKRNSGKSDTTEREVLRSLKELIDIRKEDINKPPQNSELKYHAMLANLDRMFQKLPENIVEDLNMEFVTITYNKLKECAELHGT